VSFLFQVTTTAMGSWFVFSFVCYELVCTFN